MTQVHDTADQTAREDQPAVSVVIPAYNAEETIRRALESVAAQTYDNIVETIIVDDGSRDETTCIIRDEYPRVRLFEQPNQGAAVARNLGVGEACGEYIAFLDADDEWMPEKVAHHIDLHRQFPGVVLSVSGSRKDGEPPAAEKSGLTQIRHLRFRDVVNLADIGFNYGCTAWFMRRDAFMEVDGFRPEFVRGQDSELLWRVTAAGYGVAFIDRELFVSYPSWDRRSTSDWRRTMLTWEESIDDALAEHVSADGQQFHWLSQDETDRILAASLTRRALLLCSIGEQENARELLKRSFQHTRPGPGTLMLYAGSFLPAGAQIFLLDVAKVLKRRLKH
jgi:glycosyltransferase involved in cell wall biosynthesis